MTHDGFQAAPDDDALRGLDSRVPREVLDDILGSLNAAARSHAAASALVFTSLMVATATLAALVLVPYEIYKGRKRLAALEAAIKSLNQRYSQYGILLRRRTLPAGAVASAAASSGRVRPTGAAAAAVADSSIYSYSDSAFHSAYSGGWEEGPEGPAAPVGPGDEVFGERLAAGVAPPGGSGSWDVELQVLY
ncbi:hypothetical protein HXX76_013901 [Chlamydomonas incerta]|uniref:Uncharacterized protein n=1 Tax=Chlamydomonas incerta TaxID=51695 RepID=A0A835SHT5_CHLIN|nr:hypothetical protein HXX76_013901 [Chlamydomonas incerta]|eukprot:KAG2425147.1 hypothetical protein HXX76_013901 [Chlamydomonas incerta]